MTQFLPNYGQNTSFTATLTHAAHMLQLHRVDSTRNRKQREETGYDAVELEVKRGIWWYIAGTDWLVTWALPFLISIFRIPLRQMKDGDCDNHNP